MVHADDVLELLLPGADESALRRAREVTQFLRLLCDDARRSRAPAVGLDLDRAREALSSEARAALERALEDLLRHHLAAVRPVDACAWALDPSQTVAETWREIEAARSEHADLPELPRPGEDAVASGARVLAALDAHADEARARLWRARWIQAVGGPRAGEPLFRELLVGGRRPRPAPSILRAAIAGVAECFLERGAVREARAWLGEHALQVSVDPRLRQLFAWTRILLEDAAGARTVLQGLAPWPGPLPHALLDLREARPEWVFALAGRAEPAGEGPARALGLDLRERADCGASALLVLAFAPGRGADPLVFDAAPALLGRREAWLAEREGAHGVAGEREQQLVARAAPIVERALPGEALRGALGGRATRAIALAPILDDEGDAAGWIHLEFEHQLVPALARLAACAAHWRGAVLAARARVAHDPPASAPRVPAGYAAVFRALVDDLGPKTALRRWCGFAVSGEGETSVPLLVAHGGEGQGLDEEPRGRARGLARALASGGRIAFDEPDVNLAVHAGAASGVVLPVRLDGAPVGLLAIESSRRRDFQGVDLEAWSARADAAAIAIACARFAAWHLERFGFEPWFEPRRPDFRLFAERLVRAARSRAAALVVGPAGAGKLVIARWLHFESTRRAGPLVVQGPSAQRVEWPRILARATGGTLVLEDIEAFDPLIQELLVRELEDGPDHEPESAPRIVATTRGIAGGSALRGDLALRLGRLRLAVPALAERREEIPGLAESLARRFAAEEEVAPPRLTDDASACLWRQPWPGNVRELENLVYELVVARPGEIVDAADLERVARESGRALVRRLPTRRPHARDLLAALWTTQTQSARSNKTRAATYLGWDPDTLVAKLIETGLADRIQDAGSWSLDAGATEREPARVAEPRAGRSGGPE